jgi:hypothetical protein
MFVLLNTLKCYVKVTPNGISFTPGFMKLGQFIRMLLIGCLLYQFLKLYNSKWCRGSVYFCPLKTFADTHMLWSSIDMKIQWSKRYAAFDKALLHINCSPVCQHVLPQSAQHRITAISEFWDGWDQAIWDTIQSNKLRGLSPRANYTDWATTACRRS